MTLKGGSPKGGTRIERGEALGSGRDRGLEKEGGKNCPRGKFDKSF
jgi:hypothetical protein